MRFILLFLLSIQWLFSQGIIEKSEDANIYIEKISSLPHQPWAMEMVSSNELMITLKKGQIVLLNLDTHRYKTIHSLSDVLYEGQGGLLDVAISPNFNSDKSIYFTWVKKTHKGGVVVLSKAIYENKRLNNWKDIFISKSASETSRHFAGRIAFDKNSLFLSIGDRGVRKNAQDNSNHAGTILRLTLEGKPYAQNSLKGLSEIYSFGHRNAQGLFYDDKRKLLFSNEHGPRGGDEINLVKQGLNYGWPIISYGKEYWAPVAVGIGTHKEGMQQPLKFFIPSIAPSSLIVYQGNIFPKWKGSLLSGALKLQHLNRVVFNEKYEVIKEERLLQGLNERIRDIIEDEKGYIYLCSDSGAVYKLSSKKQN